MTLTLILPPDIEAKLRQASTRSGRDLESLVIEALNEKLGGPAEAIDDDLTFDRWQARLRESLAALPVSQAKVVDDSRESIYKGRGE